MPAMDHAPTEGWKPIASIPKGKLVWVTRDPDWNTTHPEEGFMRTFVSPQQGMLMPDKRILTPVGSPVSNPLFWQEITHIKIEHDV